MRIPLILIMILDEIVEHKRTEVEAAKARVPQATLEGQLAEAAPVRAAADKLKVPGCIRVIAELKKASPSGGLLSAEFVPGDIAREYESNGAAALSVLTDEKYFQGCLEYMKEAKAATSIPVLRKDFVIDPYQIYEAKAAGADLVLLIVRILSREELEDFLRLTRELGMEALVETHSESELVAAVEVGSDIIGVNNRNLDTLTVDLETTRRLRGLIPEGPIVVSESGIKTAEDMRKLREWQVDAVLVGESLMRSPDRGKALAELVLAGRS